MRSFRACFYVKHACEFVSPLLSILPFHSLFLQGKNPCTSDGHNALYLTYWKGIFKEILSNISGFHK